ncbi:MAG: ABC transporter substrate-binding protein, partial [Rhizobacter sp.]|nr:ABC transporter substrate-binding protein [Rhizobacter sp.]
MALVFTVVSSSCVVAHVQRLLLSIRFRVALGKTRTSIQAERSVDAVEPAARKIGRGLASCGGRTPIAYPGLALMRFVFRLAMCSWLLAAAGAACAGEPIRIMVAGLDKQIYLPASLAQRLGYFKRQGLVVQLLEETSGVHAEDQLLTGAVQGVVGFYDHTIALQAKGKFVQAVVQLGQAPGEATVVASRVAGSIRTPADLRNHAVGITGLGSSTHLLTQFVALDHGLKPADVRY